MEARGLGTSSHLRLQGFQSSYENRWSGAKRRRKSVATRNRHRLIVI